MVLHERVILIMVTMSRPGNYDLRLNVCFVWNDTTSLPSYKYFFYLSAAKNLKVVNTASLGPLFEFIDGLGQAACHKCSPF